MNTTTKWLVSCAALGMALGSTANAADMTWTDYINFTPDRLVTPEKPVPYVHDLTDNVVPFIVGSDSVTSYDLRINLYDDKSDAWYEPFELAWLNLPGLTGDRVFFDLSGTEYGGWSIAGAWQIQSLGQLSVEIISVVGDFYVGDSTLTVRGQRGNSVPEPGTLALFGAALLGFGLIRRRRTI